MLLRAGVALVLVAPKEEAVDARYHGGNHPDKERDPGHDQEDRSYDPHRGGLCVKQQGPDAAQHEQDRGSPPGKPLHCGTILPVSRQTRQTRF